MLPQDNDRLVVEEVESHYAKDDSPYYLAELGKFFREQHITIPDSVRFKDYLKSCFNGRLVVVQDELHPERIAIALPAKEHDVLQRLTGRLSSSSDGSQIDFTRLSFALTAAFCKTPPPDNRLYSRVVPPFRYEVRQHTLNKDYVEIADDFRPSTLAGRSVRDLSDQERQLIYDHIESWADLHSIDLRTFYYDNQLRAHSVSAKSTASKDNALRRLIDAQEPGLRSSFRIPSDIARTLMELP